jgi:hypothetical protein
MATFGQGINPSLGRIDYSGYQQGAMAGSQAVGQGIAALGQAAGTAIQNYYKKQQEKQVIQVATQRVSDALKNNPALSKQFGISDPNDTKAINVGIKAMGGGDAMKGSQITLSMLNQLQQQEAENQAFRAATSSVVKPGNAVAQYVSAGGQNALGFAKYQTDQAQAQSAMNLQAAQAANQRSEAQARGVAKPQEGVEMTADQIAKLNAQGMDYTGVPLANGRFLVSKVSPFQPAKAAIEPGYEPDPNKPGSVRPIPGGSADMAIKEKQLKFERSVADAKLKAQNVIDIAGNLLPKINNWTSGLAGNTLAKLPQTDAKDLQEQIKTIEANIGFDRLQEMRNNSPTGGALGNVSNTELDLLTKSWRSLSQAQTPAQLKENLGAVVNHYNRFLMTMEGVDPNAVQQSRPASTRVRVYNPQTGTLE